MPVEHNVGSDRVSLLGEAVLVESTSPIPDWKVTRYRRTAIVYEERAYFVAAGGETPDGVHVYLLEPWPDDLHDRPRTALHYDAAFARTRDAHRQRAAQSSRATAALAILGPLVGFLPRRLKLSWHERYGLDPLVATRQSVFLEYLAMLGSGTLSVIGLFTMAFGGALPWLLLACLVLGTDWLARSHSVATDSLDQPGFYEWAWNPVKRL